MNSRYQHSEKELCQLIAAGDEQAFEHLFEIYVPKLTPLALRLTKDREVVKEIIQETFLRLWLTRDQLGEIENPAGWIHTIAANQCYKYLRRLALQQKLPAPAPPTVQLEEIINVTELKSLINTAVAQLPAQRQKIYLLSRVHGLSIPEIAAQLGLSANTVKNTLVSALKFIREFLAEHGYTLPLLLLHWL